MILFLPPLLLADLGLEGLGRCAEAPPLRFRAGGVEDMDLQTMLGVSGDDTLDVCCTTRGTVRCGLAEAVESLRHIGPTETCSR